MSTRVRVNTRTNTITYVTDQVMRSVKDIIGLVGLDPTSLDWESTETALGAWLGSEHLQVVTLEIYSPRTDALVHRWDITIDYNHGTNADETFWNDLAATKYAIAKAGQVAKDCKYDIKVKNKPGHPDVAGWGSCSYRSTEGMVKQSVGTTIGSSSIGAQTDFWRKQ
jgi:hypothetical protein